MQVSLSRPDKASTANLNTRGEPQGRDRAKQTSRTEVDAKEKVMETLNWNVYGGLLVG